MAACCPTAARTASRLMVPTRQQLGRRGLQDGPREAAAVRVATVVAPGSVEGLPELLDSAHAVLEGVVPEVMQHTVTLTGDWQL